MLSEGDKLQEIERHVLASGGVPIGMPHVRPFPGDLRGRFGVELLYESGHRLAVFILVDVSRGYPLWVRYSFYLRDRLGRCVFRYDNAAHYPEMSTFPHHKHVGPDKVAGEHLRPSLRHVLDEVERSVSRPAAG